MKNTDPKPTRLDLIAAIHLAQDAVTGRPEALNLDEIAEADKDRAQGAIEIMLAEDIFRLPSRVPSRLPLSPELLRTKRARYRRNLALRQASTLPVAAS